MENNPHWFYVKERNDTEIKETMKDIIDQVDKREEYLIYDILENIKHKLCISRIVHDGFGIDMYGMYTGYSVRVYKNNKCAMYKLNHREIENIVCQHSTLFLLDDIKKYNKKIEKISNEIEKYFSLVEW